MHNEFISKDHLKQLLNDIQHFLITHKTTKKDNKTSEKQKIQLSQQQQQRLKQKLSHLHTSDLAHILEGLPLNDRLDVWAQIPAEQRGTILVSVSTPVRNSMLNTMPLKDIVSAADQLPGEEISDLASLVQKLPDQAVEQILASLTQEQRQQMEEALAFPAGTVGSLMDYSMLTANEDESIGEVLSNCRKLGVLPDHSHQIYIVDQENTLLGLLSIQTLIVLPFEQKVSEVMSHSMVTFSTADSAEQATFAFNRYALTSAPVVDDKNKLIGRICIDDILDFIHESTNQQMLRQIGFTSSEDWFSGIWTGAKNRWVWLSINLLSAFIATRVIGLFEEKIVELVVLATLMPIVSATAGNIGNQACTLIIRSLALGQVTDNNLYPFYFKEVGISLINGLIWGGLMGAFVAYLYGIGIGAVMGTAILINFVLTCFVAISIPVLRQRLELDPAIGAHVLVTFFADTFGFFIFLGMATVFL